MHASSAITFLSWLSSAAFASIGVLAVRDARRCPTRPNVLLAAALGLLTVVTVTGKINEAAHYSLRAVSDLGLVAFAASGYMLLEYRGTIVRLSNLGRTVAVTTLGGSALALLVLQLPMGPKATIPRGAMVLAEIFIFSWSACVLEPAVRFLLASRRLRAVERARMRLLSATFIGIVLLFAVAIAAGTNIRNNDPARLAIQTFALLLAPILYAGAVPPQRLRRRWLGKAARAKANAFVTLGTWYWDILSDQVFWSPELWDAYGLGTHTFSPTYADFLERMHPDDRPWVDQIVHASVRTPAAFSFDHRIVRSDGEVRWFQSRGDVFTDPTTGTAAALFGTSLDITDRKLAEHALRTSQAQLAEAQRIASVGSWYWDLRTHHATWSDEMYHLLGVRREEYVVDLPSFEQFIHPDDRKHVTELTANVQLNAAPFTIEYRIIRADGDLRWLRGSGRPSVSATGEVVGYHGTIQDITGHKRAEEGLRQALHREREASERLRELDRMKDALLVAVSHELRTPLTVIQGVASTLLRDEVWQSRERFDELLVRLNQNSERLGKLLMDLLDLDRLRRGVLEPRRQPVDVAELVRRVLLDVDLHGRRVSVSLTPVTASIDAAQTERIVENLVANAVKHTPPHTPIHVRVRPHGGGVLFTVEDEGDGVLDGLKSKVFEPFQRGDTSPHAPGTGIGLSLVARFAQLHGGRAWVEDRPGGGAIFHVFIAGEETLEIANRQDDGQRAAAAS